MGKTWQEGGCLCGAVRYRLRRPPVWTALCHCESCRRAASAPVVAWMGFEAADVIWSGDRQFYKSSDIATRSFCPTCGAQLSFQSINWPGEIHLYAATLDNPEQYRPQLHCHHAEHLEWLTVADDLPHFAGTAEVDAVQDIPTHQPDPDT